MKLLESERNKYRTAEFLSTACDFLGGYCLGGTVAFEVAQQLQAEGETVALLALFDTLNWHRIPLTIWSKSSHATQRLFFHAASFFSIDSEEKAKFLTGKACGVEEPDSRLARNDALPSQKGFARHSFGLTGIGAGLASE